ncbi:MAG TPA: alpha/beta hydrolase [Amycolatopsis sp.]|uniref:alpha/beta hydrolase n=1 Tax=Amycolatopsis sp. TaxID=37632 RepID=UPI002B47FD52|nr:alpha/beta hydrolase [Amycolatopsis sp.]HKS46293.1 alpha/beta hydrolase [Amycolatopsis sp.]
MNRLRAAIVVPTLAGSLLAGSTAFASPAEGPLNSTNIPDRYSSQVLNWHGCTPDELSGQTPPAGAEGIECATFQSPRNWYRTEDKIDVTIAVSRLKAAKNSTASVLVNPGGPGAPGRMFPTRLRNQGKLREHQEIVGFDPRGTGKSTNITCGGTVGTGSDLDPRDRSRPNLNLILDATKYTADACQAKSGELGPLINTDQTVHDLDLLRVLLGRNRVNWVGYSAGTWLGAHYAQAFPDRTGRFVLDSNTEFTTTWQKSFDWQPMGFERRWREDFLPWLAQYDKLFHYGTTGEAARQTYERVRYALTQHPVEIDGAKLSANEFDAQIVPQLYDKRAFPGLADFLASVKTLTEGLPAQNADRRARVEAAAANPDARALGPQPLVVPSDYDDAYDASFWTIPCNEGPWLGNRQTAIQQSAELGPKYPLLGWGWLIQACIFWKNSPAPLPVLDGRGVPPILMVQSTHDPATPIEGASRAHQAFRGSRLITVTGEGDHGIYAGGNAGVDKVVESYLVDGVVPNDQSLPGMPLPVLSDS